MNGHTCIIALESAVQETGTGVMDTNVMDAVKLTVAIVSTEGRLV